MSASSRVSIEEFERLVAPEVPFLQTINAFPVTLDPEVTVFCARCDDRSLRPGGTVSGPVMMALADAAFYGVILANIGHVPLAVTTNLSINFLRKPGLGDLYCNASILKLGKRLAVCEATLYTEDLGPEKAVAHATGTYSIPPER